MSKTYDDIKAEACVTAAKSGKRVLDDLTDAEFREETMANHIWLNAFSCVRPTDEFLKEVGQMVLDKLNTSDLVDSLIGRTPHAIIHLNKS